MDEIPRLLGARTDLLLAVALALGLAATILSVIGISLARKLARPLQDVEGATGSVALLSSVLKTVEQMRQTTEDLGTRFDRHIGDSRGFIRHVGQVRFNAFDDIAGQQSYTLCLLDGDKNGVLLTFLATRNSARFYVVPLTRGEAPRELSEEEKQSIEDALSNRPRPTELQDAARV